MAQPSGIDLAITRLEAALEAACGAVVVLESIRSRVSNVADELREVHGQVALTLSEIRSAIEELAHLRNEHVSIGALGFVAGSEFVGERHGSSGRPE